MPEYRIPNNLSDFQRAMYVHLIDWKRKYITSEPGQYRGHWYDALLPESYAGKFSHLYEPVRRRLREHQQQFPFMTHKFADHMASSRPHLRSSRGKRRYNNWLRRISARNMGLEGGFWIENRRIMDSRRKKLTI